MLVAIAMVTPTGASGLESRGVSRQASMPPPGPGPHLALPGQPAPALAAIVLPRHAPPESYRLNVIDLPIETAKARVMAVLAPRATPDDPPGAWIVRQVDPLEAFGDVGIYDRSRLARLYAGKPARVLRAPVESNGRVVGSVTLISPYPDARLSRLFPGTVAILFLVDAARQ